MGSKYKYDKARPWIVEIAVPTCRLKKKVPFRLLELPAELRNRIYEYIALEYDIVLSPRANGRLATSSPLAKVSHQVREEYLGLLYVTAPTIRVPLTDWNFAHVIKFFNTLSQRELNALPTVGRPSSRCLHINVKMTSACGANPEELQRWLKRRQDPTKKGFNIDVSYSAHGKRSGPYSYFLGPGTWRPRWHTSSYPHPLSPVGKMYENMIQKLQSTLPAGRIREEVEKIAIALQNVSGPSISGRY